MTDDLFTSAPQWWLDGLQPSDAELQAMADEYQRDAIASAQSEQAFQDNVKEYSERKATSRVAHAKS